MKWVQTYQVDKVLFSSIKWTSSDVRGFLSDEIGRSIWRETVNTYALTQDSFYLLPWQDRGVRRWI